MTTSVKVSAHCADNVRVKIVVHDGKGGREETILKNGETADVNVYDSKLVTVGEIAGYVAPAEMTEGTGAGNSEASGNTEVPGNGH